MRGVSSKNVLVPQRIALDLLNRCIGERLPTVLEYQELLGVGSGTVQKALAEVVGSGAVKTQARGHQGTFVVEIHSDRLWDIAGLGPVKGVMPLPNSTEWAGLATGLRSGFAHVNIPLQALYVHGSYRRTAMVAEGEADFAILSREAADHVSEKSDRYSRLDLGEHTYYSDGSLIVLRRPGLEQSGKAGEHLRVGIDSGSYDHTRLTRSEFPESEGYTYVECAYPHIPAATAEARIDTAVWNHTMLPIPVEMTGITVRALARPESVALGRALGSGVVLYSRCRTEVASVLESLDLDSLRNVQERVVSKEILPTY